MTGFLRGNAERQEQHQLEVIAIDPNAFRGRLIIFEFILGHDNNRCGGRDHRPCTLLRQVSELDAGLGITQLGIESFDYVKNYVWRSTSVYLVYSSWHQGLWIVRFRRNSRLPILEINRTAFSQRNPILYLMTRMANLLHSRAMN